MSIAEVGSNSFHRYDTDYAKIDRRYYIEFYKKKFYIEHKYLIVLTKILLYSYYRP
jgi:hypothetical protein